MEHSEEFGGLSSERQDSRQSEAPRLKQRNDLQSEAADLKQYDAIILAGGQGRRLNRDKARLELANGRVLGNLIDLCCDLFSSVILVVDRIGRVLPSTRGVRVVADEIPLSGPLGGVLTGLRASSSPTCFVTACDLPFLHRNLVQYLAHCVSNQDVVVAACGDSVEPLVGFYAKTCCDAIRRSIEKGDLQVRGFWPQVTTEIVDLAGHFDTRDLQTWLLNVNTRGDLEMAEDLASSGSWQ